MREADINIPGYTGKLEAAGLRVVCGREGQRYLAFAGSTLSLSLMYVRAAQGGMYRSRNWAYHADTEEVEVPCVVLLSLHSFLDRRHSSVPPTRASKQVRGEAWFRCLVV